MSCIKFSSVHRFIPRVARLFLRCLSIFLSIPYLFKVDLQYALIWLFTVIYLSSLRCYLLLLIRSSVSVGFFFPLQLTCCACKCWDRLFVHYAKWNKSVIKGQILCDPSYMRSLEQSNSRRQKVEQGLPGLRGGGTGS